MQQQEIVESIKTKVNFGKSNHKLIEFKMLREIRWKLKKKRKKIIRKINVNYGFNSLGK